MKPKVIKASEIEEYEGKPCPQCKKGVMKRELYHDAMESNGTKLKCSQGVVPCGFTIDIYTDK